MNKPLHKLYEKLHTSFPVQLNLSEPISILQSSMSSPAQQSRLKNLAWPSQMPDDDWVDVSSGLPAKDEPFIKKYLSGREALIDQEKKQRSGMLHLAYFLTFLTSSTQTTHSANPFPLWQKKLAQSFPAFAITNKRRYGRLNSKISLHRRLVQMCSRE